MQLLKEHEIKSEKILVKDIFSSMWFRIPEYQRPYIWTKDEVNELLDDSLDLYASALNYFQLLVEEQTIRLKRAVAAGKLAAAKKREELELGSASVLPFQHR